MKEKQDVYEMTDDQRYWYDFGGTKAAYSLLLMIIPIILILLFIPDKYEFVAFAAFGIIALVALKTLNPNSRLNWIDRRIAIAARISVDMKYDELQEETDGPDAPTAAH